MLYTLILHTIRLFSKVTIPIKIFNDDIEDNYHCIIPIIEYIEYHPTQEELDDLV